jgi:predicted ATP-grasp superfamily ATP-dependent carboligase
VKPLIGEGSGGLSLVGNEGQLVAAVEKVSRETSSRCCLVQEFVEGVSASVSLISTGAKALPVSLNWQNVSLRAPEFDSSYEGGFVPLESPLRAEVFSAAAKVVEAFGGLLGYVGVDVVLAEDGAVAMEVNPRLTTSVVGLSHVANFSVAQAVLNAVLEGELPSNAQSSGCAFFSKVPVPTPEPEAFRVACEMSEVVSPPFPLGPKGLANALVQGCGGTLKQALLRFREAKKRLRRISQGGE